MNKIALIILTIGLAVALGIIFTGGGSTSKEDAGAQSKSVEVRDGVQYITISARGGYNPNVVTAAGGIPTKLIMETKGTFDCSAALVVRSAGFQKILPPTGKTEIDLGVPKAGEPVTGVCGMGMYSFQINFK